MMKQNREKNNQCVCMCISVTENPCEKDGKGMTNGDI